jgi:hypothetical protein
MYDTDKLSLSRMSFLPFYRRVLDEDDDDVVSILYIEHCI